MLASDGSFCQKLTQRVQVSSCVRGKIKTYPVTARLMGWYMRTAELHVGTGEIPFSCSVHNTENATLVWEVRKAEKMQPQTGGHGGSESVQVHFRDIGGRLSL